MATIGLELMGPQSPNGRQAETPADGGARSCGALCRFRARMGGRAPTLALVVL